ncbi:sulfatase [Haloferula helveola]|uniref:Sulfatase n=1 Tax=Haloferula helveola TaxID=490095 RepID=A0ABM7R7Y8_9BACT|nr:sulfatase [Haloferula helveola]
MKTPLCTGHASPVGLSRRDFLNSTGVGLGGIALAHMMGRAEAAGLDGGALEGLHFPAKVKRVIYLFQSGGPSQMDLFDHKPRLEKEHGQELPASVRMGQRLTGMSTNQASFPLVGSPFKFARHGDSGATVSELLPHTAGVVDDLCFIKSMYTEAINHGPGVTMMQTGSQFPGRPSIGSWLSYGLGTMNSNLPDFVVLTTHGAGGQPLTSRYWGSGFLPGKHDGVRFAPNKDAVLYLNSPEGVSRANRRAVIEHINRLHQLQLEKTADPYLETQIAQYEMAFRMQASVPEVTDIHTESKATLEMYGDDVTTPGTYAHNCLLARRLAERGVRFIQLYHKDWDAHASLPGAIRNQCRLTDQPSAALIKDLKSRGMLEDTLVIWGGEFGRTNYCQGKLTPNGFGRDHHPRCFTMWMAGGGVKGGLTHGETDDYSYNIVKDGVHVHDLHATILHLLGIDHERLTFKYQGRHFRLTDVHGKLVKGLLA